MTGPSVRCRRCESRISPDDLRCPICNLTCVAASADDRRKVRVDILRCTGCGAAMSYDISHRTAACAFCGSILELEQPADPVEEADEFLPFTVDAGMAKTAFGSWLGTLGWFRPGDLRSGARLEVIRPLHWVGWVFDARAEISWAADTDAGALRSDWAPHAGRVDLHYDDVVLPATRGLDGEEVAHLLPSYDLGSVGSVSDVVTDAAVERFDLPRSSARHRLVDAIERLGRRRIAHRHLPGVRSRNLHTATVLRALEARRVAFPAWVLAYRYRKRLYRTVLSGQDASCLEGQAPYSTARILAVVAGAVAALVLLGLVLLS